MAKKKLNLVDGLHKLEIVGGKVFIDGKLTEANVRMCVSTHLFEVSFNFDESPIDFEGVFDVNDTDPNKSKKPEDQN